MPGWKRVRFAHSRLQSPTMIPRVTRGPEIVKISLTMSLPLTSSSLSTATALPSIWTSREEMLQIEFSQSVTFTEHGSCLDSLTSLKHVLKWCQLEPSELSLAPSEEFPSPLLRQEWELPWWTLWSERSDRWSRDPWLPWDLEPVALWTSPALLEMLWLLPKGQCSSRPTMSRSLMAIETMHTPWQMWFSQMKVYQSQCCQVWRRSLESLMWRKEEIVPLIPSTGLREDRIPISLILMRTWLID